MMIRFYLTHSVAKERHPPNSVSRQGLRSHDWPTRRLIDTLPKNYGPCQLGVSNETHPKKVKNFILPSIELRKNFILCHPLYTATRQECSSLFLPLRVISHHIYDSTHGNRINNDVLFILSPSHAMGWKSANNAHKPCFSRNTVHHASCISVQCDWLVGAYEDSPLWE